MTESVVAAPPPEPPKPDRAQLLAAEETRLAEAIARADEPLLAEFALRGATTKLRQRAAGAIADPERIRALIRTTRGSRDNAVYRILTAKRDMRLQQERAATQRQTDRDAIVMAVARHARLPWDPLYEPTLLEHERRWREFEPEAPQELQAAVGRDLAAAHQVLRDRRAEQEAASRRRGEAEESAARAQAVAEQAAAERAATASAEAARCEAVRAAQQAQALAEADSARALIGLLRQTQAALERGGSARAAQLREALADRLREAPAPALPAWFTRQLEQVDEQLATLKDWHAFTAGPKRAELIERMRALVGAEIAPEQLAQHIKRHQQEWRTLHRGAGEDDSAEAGRFRELSRQAYEPCRQHFAAQAAQRAENREKREAILAQLAACSSQQAEASPDWRLVAQTLAQARREWRRYAPVDQAIAASLQARFRSALEELGGRLDAEQARNLEARRSLVARAEALAGLADVREAIAAAKDLQREWKTIGIVPHDPGNALWESFRRHCSAVFERSAQEAAAWSATLAANAARAVALSTELHHIATLEGAALREAMTGLAAAQEAFDGLDLPRPQARELRQQFQRALECCADAAQRDRVRAKDRAWSALFDAAAAIRACAFARLSGASSERLEPLRTAALAALGVASAAPKFARMA
ncbi:MAG: DUF349 domain-containing protein, partial [Gammaproteobacteria bacterium]|nr:DUF349 domain-containing protein [Gammaproteobacteria bacterium]